MKKIFAFICVLIFSVSVAQAMPFSEYNVDDYKVYILPENQMKGNTGVLINASPSQINSYFKEKNFPMYLNTYIIKGPKQTILVDSGFGNQLFNHLETLDIKPEDIDIVLLTHLHGDHIGGMLVEDKVAFPNAHVWLAKKELDYWLDKDIQAKMPEAKQGGFVKAQKMAEAYKGKIHTFEPKALTQAKNLSYSPDKEGLELMPNIRALATYGHTPGHTAFFVGKGKDALLIWGDIVHVEKIQMPLPKTGVVFDYDPVMAQNTRLELLDFARKHKIKVTGMHIGRPKASFVKKEKNGYVFEEVK